MKKLYSFLLMCVAGCVMAQTPTYFNNNVAGGANAFPWGNANRKIQWRIVANSLGSVTGGNNISVMYFQTGTNATNTYPLLTIGLKQGVAQFAGGGTWETGFTNVFTGNNITLNTTVGGWLTFTLQTPFLYDPTQVLLIDVEQNNGSPNTMTQYQFSPAGPGAGRQYGNINTSAPVGTDATVANFGIDVVPAVPCSTPPTTNSILGPTAAICPNANAAMNVSNTYTAASGGITYQWQSSTTSSVGPFTAIPNATNSAYSAPNVTVNTWYSAVITCTNVTGTITSAAYEVTVSPVIIGNVPYYESFEGIGTSNQLPNCSWAASNLPGTCQTYVQSNTLGRTPRTGSKFASFYYSPGGTRYFYTNGINLQAGITYSAGLWFQTEYYGYNNWSDLSILYGTSQSATGQVTIATTNGPAISNVYKPLGNTFTVPTSGVYYFAIRGTGTTNSSAQYLTWDDLSITIPCDSASGNVPNLSLSANNATICEGQPVVLSAAGADTYTWNTGSNASVLTESPTINTSYVVVGTNSLTGCTQTLTQNITVLPSPAVFIIANKTTVCSGSPVQLTALGAGSYTWSSGSMNNVTTVSPSSNTTYTVLASNASGCVGLATQAISVNPLPNVQASSSAPTFYCYGEPLTLSATGAVNYQWISNTSPVVHNGAQISVMPGSSTTYTIIGTDANGCQKSTTLVQIVETCSGINEANVGSVGIELFPNPTKGEFSIVSKDKSDKKITVYDLTGKELLTQQVNTGNAHINMSGYANGIYYVKVQNSNSSEIIKLVKE